ncbi:branched chain amino acid aminotransferase [Prosthecomicrobium hirschii]|nr:branched chain amino acid aminotransferase [Prosthecomicrobium hirschii]
MRTVMSATAGFSRTWNWIDGQWIEGNPAVIGPRTHAAWLGSSVFDGARAFEGVAPDLDRHCERVNRSAVALGLKPTMPADAIEALARDGIRLFDDDTALYIRPMYWAEQGGYMSVPADPDSTRFCLCIYETPMPEPTGFSVTLSPFRRPTRETMPLDAKAGCLYPNNARAALEARARGFDNAVVCDMLGNVAELATANFFYAKDGVVFTPAPNGTFLNGITRQRTIELLRHAGTEVVETTVRYDDLKKADELFSTGNYSKVVPITRIEDRDLQPGPFYAKARRLYWEFAHA